MSYALDLFIFHLLCLNLVTSQVKKCLTLEGIETSSYTYDFTMTSQWKTGISRIHSSVQVGDSVTATCIKYCEVS